MKILLLAPQPFYQVRGTPIAIDLLVSTLTKQGHQVDLLTYHEGEPRDYLQAQHFRIHHFSFLSNIQPGFSFKKLLCSGLLFIKAFPMVRRNNYDLVHANEEAVFMAYIFKKLFKQAYVYDMDSTLVGQMIDKMPALRLLRWPFERIENTAIKNSEGVLAVCEALCKIARPYNNNVKLLTDVSMLDRLQASNDVTDLDIQFSLSGTKLMYIGNLEAYQGIDLLIDAFASALKRNPSLHLIIIGGSGPAIELYKTSCKSLGISESVVFTGPKPFSDLDAYMQQADILLSPRIQGENTPMKIYNYMASGKPIIATDIVSHTQVLDKDIAVLVDVDIDKLAKAILKLASSKETQARLGKRCAEHAKHHYSVESFEAKVAEFYQSLI